MQRRALVLASAFLLGLAATRLGRHVLRAESGERDGDARIELWCADRGAGLAVGLDRNLIARRTCAVVSPRRIAATRDGGAWLLSGEGQGGAAPLDLVRIEPAGRRTEPLRVARVPSAVGWTLLEVSANPAAAVWLEAASTGQHEVIAFSRGGPPERMHVPGARAIASGSHGRVLVGMGDGELLALRTARGAWDPAPASRAHVRAPIVAVAPAALGGWWVATEDLSVVRLTSALERLYSWSVPAVGWPVALSRVGRAPEVRSTAVELEELAWIERGGRRVWLASSSANGVRPFGSPLTTPLGGLRAGAACLSPGRAPRLVVALPGAVLALQSGGGVQSRGRRGFELAQGGFHDLVDVSVRPNRWLG